MSHSWDLMGVCLNIILNDTLVAPSASLKGQTCWFLCEDFMPLLFYMFSWDFKSFDRISIDVVPSYEEVVVCHDLFFCQNNATVNEKTMTIEVWSLMNITTILFFKISLYILWWEWCSFHSKVHKFISHYTRNLY